MHFLHCLFMYYHAPFRLVCFYLTENKSAFCALFVLFLFLLATPFKIGAVLRLHSHLLFFTEPRSPFSCHRQQSHSVLRNSQIKNLPPVFCSISARCFAPAHITCISQKVALPFSATGSGLAFELCSISARCFAPAHITCISQKVALPFSATGSGLAFELCSISTRCFAPAHTPCISQKVALPFSATGSGRACFSHWRRSLLVLCSFVSSHSLRS